MVKKAVESPPLPPKLIIPRVEAKEKLQQQLERGQEIQGIQINSPEMLATASDKKKKWQNYVAEMLLRYFDNETIKKEFSNAHGSMTMAMDFYDELENYVNSINAKVTTLESIIERLDLIPENLPATAVIHQQLNTSNIKDVFIVHGHDEATKANVARFIHSIGLNPIILHEQPNDGRTIIEKLEHYSKVGFAIVIMSPDDMGHPVNEPEKIQARARQNVLVELGYFVGTLSRKNVCVLYSQGVELPTDLLGVAYVALDSGEGWKFPLAREIKSAGMSINLNNAF